MVLKGLDDAGGSGGRWAGRVAVAKGQDAVLRFRILAGDGRGQPVAVMLMADALASATSLVIHGDHAALSSGDKLLSGDNIVETTSGAAAVGVTSVAMTAIAGLLRQGSVLQKVADLTGYTLSMEVLSNRGDATPVLTASAVVATQTATDRGICTVTVQPADTSSLDAGPYYAALWRRDSGQVRLLCEFTLDLQEAGFL